MEKKIQKKEYSFRHRVIRMMAGGLIFGFLTYIVVGLTKTELVVTNYYYHNQKIPTAFDGYKIVLLSDLHHKEFGKNQSKLIKKIKKIQPDLIVMTGDIVDKNHTDMSSVEDLIKGVTKLAQVYYVSGNHEKNIKARTQYEKLQEMMIKYGVIDLDFNQAWINREQEAICLTGVGFCGDAVVKKLKYADESVFNILLYHASNCFDQISSYGYDIILSGHSHGGIVRLPFIGGLFGNNRELFPKYAGGVYKENNSTLFSSKGLGDTVIPRFYNPPEIVVITLKSN